MSFSKQIIGAVKKQAGKIWKPKADKLLEKVAEDSAEAMDVFVTSGPLAKRVGEARGIIGAVPRTQKKLIFLKGLRNLIGTPAEAKKISDKPTYAVGPDEDKIDPDSRLKLNQVFRGFEFGTTFMEATPFVDVTMKEVKEEAEKSFKDNKDKI